MPPRAAPIPRRALDTLPKGWSSQGSVYFRPIGFSDRDNPLCRPLAGGITGFLAVQVMVRFKDRIEHVTAPISAVEDWIEGEADPISLRYRLIALSAISPPFAGLMLDRPYIMGIVNTTPDSFSDGGKFLDPKAAIDQARRLHEEGAEILDVGGESTRPGSDPVSLQEELDRVLPVIEALAGDGVLISIDTMKAAVMEAALSAGATIINDVTALRHDPKSLSVAAERRAPVMLMHMQGKPKTMQAKPSYADPALDVYDFLGTRIEEAHQAGLAVAQVSVDPGIGFGKTVAHNLQVLSQLSLYHGLDRPIVLGASRKRFIGALDREGPAEERIPGSTAVALQAALQGVQILRVHDVAATRQALKVGMPSFTGKTP